eukprot:Skav202812  [mRNA]  locus=scaffold326:1073910:1076220:+ [translate_table: standard]
MISRNSLELIFSDGQSRVVDLKGATSLRDLWAMLALQTRRPPSFVQLQRSQGEKLKPYDNLQVESISLQVSLTETVAEWWSSERLIITGMRGEACPYDLSSAETLGDACQIIGGETARPARFVRFLDGEQQLKDWDPATFPEVLRLQMQLAPTIHELFQAGVKINYLSGEEVPVDLQSMISIQDLRDAIASSLNLRATGVSLIASSGKCLWDSDPFDLCDPTPTITVCVRDPQLCADGHHDMMCFFNNGYNDHVCIHCGDTFFMERRTLEPKRHWP